MSSGCKTTQPLAAQNCCNAKINSWKVLGVFDGVFGGVFNGVFDGVFDIVTGITISSTTKKTDYPRL
jgi:hypothetical protein